ncbi:hypothetical protein [Streptomyces sp. NPDC087294]|uniref:hypothetical protein n=1 Tax=Streptomyces sp. NPDC087294 TaxID=3365777 RepID=UPI00381D5EAB
MDLTITVRVCEQCKSNDKPATRYVLTVESGEQVTRDLCAEDAAPLEAVFGPLARTEELSPEDALKQQIRNLMDEYDRDSRARRFRAEAEWRAQNPEAATKTPAKKTAAKKTAPAKKTAAKKAAPSKKAPAKKTGTKSLTVAEIEAMKAEGKQ